MPIETYRHAHASEAEAITTLVNQAYQPDPHMAGWTHEANLVLGNRVDRHQVSAAIAKVDSIVLIGLIGTEIVACVHLEKQAAHCHIGMFAVHPAQQGMGLGKQLLAQAESHASTEFGCNTYVMHVITSRTELIAFYLRRGYRKTGLLSDYLSIPGAGKPKISGLYVETLEKRNTALMT